MADKLLLVDDEKDILDLLVEVLQREGFSQIQKAGTGADAVALCRRFNPDVVILDIMLPDMDGIEVCRQIRTFSHCSILFLSSKNEDIDKILGLSPGPKKRDCHLFLTGYGEKSHCTAAFLRNLYDRYGGGGLRHCSRQCYRTVFFFNADAGHGGGNRCYIHR